MDALGNVAQGAEDLVKEVVTEVRSRGDSLEYVETFAAFPQSTFVFDKFRRFLALKKVASGFLL